MNRQDKEEIAAIVEAAAHHHDKRALIVRVTIAAVVLAGVYAIRVLTHHDAAQEAFHLMLEGGVAVAMEKTIFGLG